MDRSHRRSIVTYLCDHPTDFKRAVALIRQDLRGIYVSAFQSWVWNKWLSQLIIENAGTATLDRLDSLCGPLAIPISKFECSIGNRSIYELDLPLPSARQHDWPNGTLASLEEILLPLQMDVRQMRLKYPRDTFFSKGTRAAWLTAQDFSFEWEPDSLNPKFPVVKIMLCFAARRLRYHGGAIFVQ